VGLGAGYRDAEEAALDIERLATLPKPPGFENPSNIGSFSFVNSDLAFTGDFAIMGGYHGFQVYDVSDPENPTLRTAYVCPGGQGDVSVYGDLLFVSVEETRGRLDCGTQGNAGGAQPDRFRGVRIFDISDIDDPVNLGGMQSCKGSHTHSLVTDPDDQEHVYVYVYVSGTAGIRNAAEDPGDCTGQSSLLNPNTDNFSITVYKVPLAEPQAFELVNRNARVMSTCGDNSCQDQHAEGALNGLPGSGTQPAYPEDDPRAPGGQSRSQTSQCHDITAYPEIGLAAGACQGHGLLIDISDPANPKRIDAVEDFNFAYWHSATFDNDGTTVVFTDEWGGGTGARCRPTDRLNWGANAIFDIVDTEDGMKMEWRSYYKMPAPQTNQENCVAHNGSLVPVPGRDIMVQAWYQGGLSVFDFTDSSNPTEIAFFDRGPISPTSLVTGGFWSTYWWNGNAFGSEIARGFESFALQPSDTVSANEIAAASEVRLDQFNAQLQVDVTPAPSFAVVGARLDQSVRAGLDAETANRLQGHIDKAKEFLAGPQKQAGIAQLDAAASSLQERPDQADLAQAFTDLADSLR
jgi:LVIVD repeat